MILSAREYARKHAGGCSVKTVIRKIQQGLLPTNHKPKKIGRNYIIEIGEMDNLKDYNITLERKSKHEVKK